LGQLPIRHFLCEPSPQIRARSGVSLELLAQASVPSYGALGCSGLRSQARAGLDTEGIHIV